MFTAAIYCRNKVRQFHVALGRDLLQRVPEFPSRLTLVFLPFETIERLAVADFGISLLPPATELLGRGLLLRERWGGYRGSADKEKAPAETGAQELPIGRNGSELTPEPEARPTPIWGATE